MSTVTTTKPAQETRPTQTQTEIPEVRLDDDAVTLLAQGKPVSYIPLGEEQPIKLSVGMILKFIAKKTAKGFEPSFEDCTNFAMLCRARRLNPFVGDCFMLGYDSSDTGPTFSMIVAVQALFKRAEINQHYEGTQSGIIVLDKHDNIVEREGDLKHPGDTLLGGWARVYRKDRKIPTYQRLQLDTFNKGTAYWKKDPAGQISKCAEAASLRQAFPSDVGGLFLDVEIDAFAESIGAQTKRLMDLSPENGNGGEHAQPKVGATKSAPITRRTAENTTSAQTGGPGDAASDKTVSEGADASKAALEQPQGQEDKSGASAGNTETDATAGQREGESIADYWIRAMRAQPTIETLNDVWSKAEADQAMDVSDTSAVKSHYEKLAKGLQPKKK